MSAACCDGKHGAICVQEQGGGLEQGMFSAAQDQDLLFVCPGQGVPGLCVEAEEPLPRLTLAVLLLLLPPGSLAGAGVKVGAAALISYSCSVQPE